MDNHADRKKVVAFVQIRYRLENMTFPRAVDRLLESVGATGVFLSDDHRAQHSGWRRLKYVTLTDRRQQIPPTTAGSAPHESGPRHAAVVLRRLMHPLRPLADDLTTIKGFASVTSFVLRSLRTERGLVAVVGIEPWGGLSAAIVSSLLGLRYHYSSMELMHPRLKTALLSGLLRMSVRLMVGRASTIVVQDPDRAALLRKLYGVVRREVVLMPIGSIDPKNHATTTYLHDRLGVPPDKAIVIYAGSIRSWAFVRELAVSARGWPDPWVLVIHGFADPESDYYKSLLPLVDNKKVFLSTSIVEWSELDPLLCSARMSIAAFSAQDENSARVFFSSNKLANYARCGLPLLITHSEQSERMLKQIRWGETFREFSEIPSAISRIEKDYDQYRQCCSRAFDTYYDLNRHGVDFIKAITRGRRGGAMTTQGAQ